MANVSNKKISTSVTPTLSMTLTNLSEYFASRFARQCVMPPEICLATAFCTFTIALELVLKLRFWDRQDIFFPRNPHIECGKQKDIDGESTNKTSDDDDGERPLGVGADAVRHRGRE